MNVFYIIMVSMVCEQWRGEIYVNKTGILAQYWNVCRLFYLNWQEGESLENLWLRLFRIRRGVVGRSLWSLENVHEVHHIEVIWRSLHQEKCSM